MNDWIEQVDFAWVGKDSNDAIGMFYVPSDFVTNNIKNIYSFSKYNELTSFIIDELPEISECKNLYSSNFKQDILKGLYVFEYKNGLYEKKGEPVIELHVSKLKEFKSLIISLPTCHFFNDKEVIQTL